MNASLFSKHSPLVFYSHSFSNISVSNIHNENRKAIGRHNGKHKSSLRYEEWSCVYVPFLTCMHLFSAHCYFKYVLLYPCAYQVMNIRRIPTALKTFISVPVNHLMMSFTLNYQKLLLVLEYLCYFQIVVIMSYIEIILPHT